MQDRQQQQIEQQQEGHSASSESQLSAACDVYQPRSLSLLKLARLCQPRLGQPQGLGGTESVFAAILPEAVRQQQGQWHMLGTDAAQVSHKGICSFVSGSATNYAHSPCRVCPLPPTLPLPDPQPRACVCIVQ
jgi:hypothetical protein